MRLRTRSLPMIAVVAALAAAPVVASPAPSFIALGPGTGADGFLLGDASSATPPAGAVSEFALLAPLVAEDLLAARGMTRSKKPPKQGASSATDTVAADAPAATDPSGATPRRSAPTRRMGGSPGVLTGERTRLMLQSLTVPGWGQAALGQRRAAIAFGLLEAGVWGSFTAFRIQEHLRRQTYERTARLFGGIDLGGRDEEYRRIVGLYLSSDDYNRLVVRRDAANLFFGDPAAYDAYIAAHEITAANAWSWGNIEDFLRYRAERQATQRASKHVQDALAAALVNRLLSVIHASRSHARPATEQTSWRLEVAPTGGETGAFRLALRADF